MNKRIRFKYDNSWTQWYEVDKIPSLIGLDIKCVEINEEMTKEQAEEYLKEFHDGEFNFK